MISRLVLTSSFLLWLGSAGCNGGARACAGVPGASGADTAPSLLSVTLIEDAVPGDPWELVFLLAFEDSDGDLGEGQAEVYVNNPDHGTTLDLFELFRQSRLDRDAASGEFTMPLRFSSVASDASVRMGWVLVDVAGHRSNCFDAELSFDVQSARRRASPGDTDERRWAAVHGGGIGHRIWGVVDGG